MAEQKFLGTHEKNHSGVPSLEQYPIIHRRDKRFISIRVVCISPSMPRDDGHDDDDDDNKGEDEDEGLEEVER